MYIRRNNTSDGKIEKDTLPAITGSKLTVETLEQSVKYVRS